MTGFGDIIGHEQIIEHFRSALKNHQVSHAYILNGENGSGKNMLAKAFAKALVWRLDLVIAWSELVISCLEMLVSGLEIKFGVVASYVV